MLNQQNRFSVLLPLFFVLIIDTMGMGLIMPVLGPLFISTTDGILPINSTLAQRNFFYGFSLTIYFVLMFFGAPYFGDLSDRLGRKKVLLICLFLTTFGLILSGISIQYGSVWGLIAGRAIAGFAAGSQSIAQASIADISEIENKAQNLSWMILANCIGFVIGPLMSGYLSDQTLVSWFHYSTPFYGGAILALINAITLNFTYKETFIPHQKKPLNLFKGLSIFAEAFTHPKIRVLSLTLLLLQMGWGLYLLYISLFLAQYYEFDNVKIGYFMSLFGIIWGIGLGVVIHKALKFFSAYAVALASSVLLGIGIALNLIPFEWATWFAIIPIGVGSALNYSTFVSLFSNVVSRDVQGWIMGITSAVTAVAWGSGGLVAGFLGNLSIFLPIQVAVGLVLGGVVLFSFQNAQEYKAHV